MKLWELDKTKDYLCQENALWSYDTNLKIWYWTDKDNYIKFCNDYNWEEIESYDFTEFNPTSKPKKLYAYQNKLESEVMFRGTDIPKVGKPGANESTLWFYRAPEYDITYPEEK